MAISERFPMKVELHVHLDGSLRYQTILEMGKLAGVFEPSENVDNIKSQMVMEVGNNLDKLLKAYDIFMPTIAGSRDGAYRMAYEFCEDCAKQGIKYTEVRFAPHVLANTFEKPLYSESGNFSPRDVVTTIIDAFDKGQKDFNIRVKCILCCLGNHPEWSLEVAQLCRDFGDVVAIDLVRPEESVGADLTQHVIAFTDAKKNGLHRTAHASSLDTVNLAINEYKVERMGHSYVCFNNADLLARILKENIHIETCPVSSLRQDERRFNLATHPILKYAKTKANFSINSDAPSLFNSCISDDYLLARRIGLTDGQITDTIYNAARSCFSSDQEKKALLSDLDKVYKPDGATTS